MDTSDNALEHTQGKPKAKENKPPKSSQEKTRKPPASQEARSKEDDAEAQPRKKKKKLFPPPSQETFPWDSLPKVSSAQILLSDRPDCAIG